MIECNSRLAVILVLMVYYHIIGIFFDVCCFLKFHILIKVRTKSGDHLLKLNTTQMEYQNPIDSFSRSVSSLCNILL